MPKKPHRQKVGALIVGQVTPMQTRRAEVCEPHAVEIKKNTRWQKLKHNAGFARIVAKQIWQMYDPWIIHLYMDIHGSSMDIHGYPWIVHGYPWISMALHGLSTDIPG